MRNRNCYMRTHAKWLIGIACLAFLLGVYFILSSKNELKNKLELQKALMVTKTMSSEDITFYYAYLILKANGIQQSSCYICSASGFPTDPNTVINREPFSHYHITAFVVCDHDLGSSVPIVITIPDGKADEMTFEAKVTQLTKYLYFAEFTLPREKISSSHDFPPSFIYMKCGDGDRKEYNIFYNKEGYNPYIFMNGNNLP